MLEHSRLSSAFHSIPTPSYSSLLVGMNLRNNRASSSGKSCSTTWVSSLCDANRTRSHANLYPRLRHPSYVQPDIVNGRLRLRCRQPKYQQAVPADTKVSSILSSNCFAFRLLVRCPYRGRSNRKCAANEEVHHDSRKTTDSTLQPTIKRRRCIPGRSRATHRPEAAFSRS